MKKFISTLALTALSVSAAQATVTLSGTALLNAPGLVLDQEFAVLVDNDGLGFGTLTSLGAGLSTTDSATYGANFSWVSGGDVTPLSSFSVATVNESITLGSGIDASDSFALLVFAASDGTTTASDSFAIWTDVSWLLPSEGAVSTFGGSGVLSQLSDAADFGGSVSAVPEPSTFAALAGLCALGAVMVRRRRA